MRKIISVKCLNLFCLVICIFDRLKCDCKKMFRCLSLCMHVIMLFLCTKLFFKPWEQEAVFIPWFVELPAQKIIA